MTLTALIADDEEAPRLQLREALRAAWPQIDIVAEAANGTDAWDAFLEFEPAVCFLDIRMPGLTGIEVAQRIAGRAAVVFVTAYGDHALAAFDAGAIDYVLKPIDPVRLARTVDRLQAGAAPGSAAEATTDSADAMAGLLDQLAARLNRPPALDVIQAAVGREVRQIRIDEVIYFESDARYTRVVYRSGSGTDADALIRTPLKELLAQLDARQFQQVHRSIIVARREIAAAVRIDEGNMHLTLRGRAEKLPVSRHFQALFKGQ